jgi:branched-chain amino acid transport system substrate-binding protein
MSPSNRHHASRFSRGHLARIALAILAALVLPAGAAAEILIGVAAPLSGRYHARGMESQLGAELAVAEINRAGGLLGEQVWIVSVDDGCDAEQAAAAAYSLVARGVVMVVGHSCSGAAIAAAPIYEETGVIQISPSATNPSLTERGWANVFRVCGRDDRQGRMAGDLLAERWADAAIAILHDRSTYGRGLAEETRARLNRRGVREALYLGYSPHAVDFSGLVDRLIAEGIDVVYVGGRESEIALMLLQARREGLEAPFVSGDALVSSDFWQIAGEAAQGAMFTFSPDPSASPAAEAVIARFRETGPFDPSGYTLHAHAAVQAWARAVEAAGSLSPASVRAALRRGRFDTVLGSLGFDERGDVVGIEPYVWHEWRDGEFRAID